MKIAIIVLFCFLALATSAPVDKATDAYGAVAGAAAASANGKVEDVADVSGKRVSLLQCN